MQSTDWKEFQGQVASLVDNISQVVVTSEKTLHLALIPLFSQGHLLLEDLPGVGKTLLAKTIAASIGGKFTRVQFTSDLLPGDITG
ncbi:MAG: MoxR family ATPase, partial [SAR202 cluster bacterium]|nr:MoxR family ATPase [SAR202 cluster bacterium]